MLRPLPAGGGSTGRPRFRSLRERLGAGRGTARGAVCGPAAEGAAPWRGQAARGGPGRGGVAPWRPRWALGDPAGRRGANGSDSGAEGRRAGAEGAQAPEPRGGAGAPPSRAWGR